MWLDRVRKARRAALVAPSGPDRTEAPPAARRDTPRLALEVQRVFADDEGGAVFAGVTARRDGKYYSYRHAHLWTIRNGTVTKFEEFPDDGRSQDLLFE